MTRPAVLLTLPDRPSPADGGKRMRSSATLRAFASMDIDLDVVVLFAGEPMARPLPPGVRVRDIRQVHAPPRRRLSALVAAATRLFPWQVAVLPWGVARRELASAGHRRYDLVWFGATDHALSLGRSVTASRMAVDMDDVEVPKLRAFLSLPHDETGPGARDRLQRQLELPLWRLAQRRVVRRADAVVVCSDLDRARLAPADNVAVVPNGYPQPARRVARPAPSPPTLVYIGTFSYAPNVDSAVFAARQVLPLLRERFPDARLRLVGHAGHEELGAVGALPGVDIVGPVPDPAAELARAHVALVPVRYGGGTRVKILEALAYGLPVVSTPLGCEGLEVQPGVHLLTATDAAGLARACARLIEDATLSDRLVDAGYALYASRYRDSDVQRVLRDLVGRLLRPDDPVDPAAPHRCSGSA